MAKTLLCRFGHFLTITNLMVLKKIGPKLQGLQVRRVPGAPGLLKKNNFKGLTLENLPYR